MTILNHIIISTVVSPITIYQDYGESGFSLVHDVTLVVRSRSL